VNCETPDDGFLKYFNKNINIETLPELKYTVNLIIEECYNLNAQISLLNSRIAALESQNGYIKI
jgi:hypothetical protein